MHHVRAELAILGFLACIAVAVHARKIQATIPYTLQGPQVVISADGKPNGALGIGGQVVMRSILRDGSNKQIGYMSAHCHIVSKEGAAWVAMCTKHLDWTDGSTMTAHSTEMITPGKPVSAKMVVAGGIGRWEGAHGEDMDFFYDPDKQTGGGKIVLTCLKGVC